MKLNTTERGKKQAKPSVSKIGTMLGTGALAVLAIGTISVFALTGTSVKSMDVAKADSITTTSQTDAQQTSASKVEWRKAGISEYELAQTETATTTKKVTTTAETTTKAETTAEEKASATTTAQQVVTAAATETTTAATQAPVTTQAPAKTTAAQTTQNNDTVISYTNEEFDMFCYVVQGEVGNCTENYKIAVANVIINRVKSNEFPNNIKDVLTANNQFTAINGYYNNTTPPNQNTVDCVNRALRGEDNSNGATFYYSPDNCGGSTAAWFESLQFCLEFDNARFFKNW